MLILAVYTAGVELYKNFQAKIHPGIFVPDNALFALQFAPAELSKISGVVSKDSPAFEYITAMQDWSKSLELILQAPVSHVALFATDNDLSQIYTVVSFRRALRDRDLENIQSKSFAGVALFSDAPSVKRLNRTMIALVSATSQQDVLIAKRPLFVERRNFAFYVSPGILSAKAGDTVSLLDAAIPFSLYQGVLLDVSPGRDFLRVHATNHLESEDTAPLFDLRVPDQFNLAISGPIAEGYDASRQDIVSGMLYNLQSDISHTFLMPKERINEELANFSGIIKHGEEWLVAHSAPEDLEAFGRKLASWYTPKIQESRLPDRTAFRELAKAEMSPVTETVEGLTVMSWRHASGDPALFFMTHEGKAYLSNSVFLLKSQISEFGTGVPLMNVNFILRCLGEDALQRTIPSVVVGMDVAPYSIFAHIETHSGAGNEYYYCFS